MLLWKDVQEGTRMKPRDSLWMGWGGGAALTQGQSPFSLYLWEIWVAYFILVPYNTFTQSCFGLSAS